jgi:hypothetical protein
VSEKRIVKASFQTPMLNIPPKSQQTKRAIPRSYLKAIKRVNPEIDALQSKLLNKKRMRAYKEALQMLEQI